MTFNSSNTARHLVSDSCLSENTVLLYQFAHVKDTNEAVTVLFHTFMLEYGFIPKDVPVENLCHCMPKNWNEKGVSNIKYEHRCCPPYTCAMTCVPLYSNVCVHGIICDVNCSESISLTININQYLKGTDLSDVLKAFSHIDELSRHFKDNFCMPLLNLLHETIGVNHYVGLRGLLDELKIPLLKLLPVESVVSLSAVNKDYNHLANSPFLWKFLFKRDFSADGVPDIEEDSIEPSSWKQMYIKRYRKKKEVERNRQSRIPRIPFPRLFNLRPDYDDTGISVYFDPPPPEIFPSIPPIHPIHPMFPRFFR